MRRIAVAFGVLLVTSPLWAQVSKGFKWTNPTQYEDGATLSPAQIQETRLSFSPVPGGTPTIIEVSAGAASTYQTLPVFTTGDWYVRAQTVDVSGVASDYSNEFPFTVGRCEANPASCRPRPPTGLSLL